MKQQDLEALKVDGTKLIKSFGSIIVENFSGKNHLAHFSLCKRQVSVQAAPR